MRPWIWDTYLLSDSSHGYSLIMSVIAADIITFLAAKNPAILRSLFYEMAQRRIGKSATCQIKIPRHYQVGTVTIKNIWRTLSPQKRKDHVCVHNRRRVVARFRGWSSSRARWMARLSAETTYQDSDTQGLHFVQGLRVNVQRHCFWHLVLSKSATFLPRINPCKLAGPEGACT